MHFGQTYSARLSRHNDKDEKSFPPVPAREMESKFFRKNGRSPRPSLKSRHFLQRQLRLHGYVFKQQVAQGSFSKVYLCTPSSFLKKERRLTENTTRSRKKPNSPRQINIERSGTNLEVPRYVAIKVMKIKPPAIDAHKQSESYFNIFDYNRKASALVAHIPEKLRLKARNNGPGPRTLDAIKTEVRTLKSIQFESDFIVTLIESTQFEQEFWLVQEFLEIGDLGKFCFNAFESNGNQAPDKVVQFFLVPIMLALSTLHRKGIVHKDLKDANILVSSALIPKLCDFGLAHKFDVPDEIPPGFNLKQESIVKSHVGFSGTPAFAPPEAFADTQKTIERRHSVLSALAPKLLQSGSSLKQIKEISTLSNRDRSFTGKTNSSSANFKVFDCTFDTWSLGITYLSLIFGAVPWDKKENKSNRRRRTRGMNNINRLRRYLGRQFTNQVRVQGYTKFYDKVSLNKGAEYEDFVKQCLKIREDRLTIEELLEDDHIKNFVDCWKFIQDHKFGAFEKVMEQTAVVGHSKALEVFGHNLEKEDQESFDEFLSTARQLCTLGCEYMKIPL
eukprot:augustus_masked-scaffold_35-processed-gene-1.3-mRNA-1 protein AED:1.00 eAED:1.00 QI:0/-1/0/0/-1/1/1/0/559